MPYVFVTVQCGGWDPTLPMKLEYSPELDPEIHGFLAEQDGNGRQGLIRSPGDRKGTATTECDLRSVLDGLEKLGFSLVSTTAYSHMDRPHNDFILHRELVPAEMQPSARQTPGAAVPVRKKSSTVREEVEHRQRRQTTTTVQQPATNLNSSSTSSAYYRN